MKFLNNGEAKKVRLGNQGSFYWVTVRNGQTVDLPESEGKAYGFDPVEALESKVGKTKVETKQVKKKSLLEKLQKIKGIGSKTANDIVTVFPTEEKLIDAIKSGKELPFRDDVSIKLFSYFK